MINDIKEQPDIISKLAEKYLPLDQPIRGVNLNLSDEEINSLSVIYIVASGSSRNAGNIAKYFIEDVARIPVMTNYASEFAHRNPALSKNDLVIAISQSGETADTFAALKVAKEKGSHTFAITNNPDSKIYNLADSKMLSEAGKEKSIPATKSFTAQLINLYILALYLGEKRNTLAKEKLQNVKDGLHSIAQIIKNYIENTDSINKIALKIKDSKSIILVGRGQNSAVACEGSLKIKETSYIDANGYPSGEFLHGYIAVADESIPVISVILPNAECPDGYDLAVSNTEEIKKKRNPHLIIIKNSDDEKLKQNPLFKDADFIDIPPITSELSPILAVIALQLLTLKIAEALGRDVNNPRSLSKSLTAE